MLVLKLPDFYFFIFIPFKVESHGYLAEACFIYILMILMIIILMNVRLFPLVVNHTDIPTSIIRSLIDSGLFFSMDVLEVGVYYGINPNSIYKHVSR